MSFRHVFPCVVIRIPITFVETKASDSDWFAKLPTASSVLSQVTAFAPSVLPFVTNTLTIGPAVEAAP